MGGIIFRQTLVAAHLHCTMAGCMTYGMVFAYFILAIIPQASASRVQSHRVSEVIAEKGGFNASSTLRREALDKAELASTSDLTTRYFCCCCRGINTDKPKPKNGNICGSCRYVHKRRC